MVYIHLTEGQREELGAVSRQAIGRVALRAHMVLLSDRGFTVPQIAAIQACGQDVVLTWLHRYERKGVAGLEDEPRSGRPPKDPLAGPIVDAQASQSPPCSGPVQCCWSVVLLTALSFQALSPGDLVCLGPALSAPDGVALGTAPAGACPQARRVSGDQTSRRGLRPPSRPNRGWPTCSRLDESDLQLLPLIRSMGMKGPRRRIPTPGTNRRRAFFGALDAVSGHWFSADHERKLAVHFVAFLQRLEAVYSTGSLYLALDNAPTHTAKVVGKWLAAHPRVHVLWLPKYAAHEVNPVERIWGLMKSAVAADRLAGTIEELTAASRRFFADLAPHPVKLPSAA